MFLSIPWLTSITYNSSIDIVSHPMGPVTWFNVSGKASYIISVAELQQIHYWSFNPRSAPELMPSPLPGFASFLIFPFLDCLGSLTREPASFWLAFSNCSILGLHIKLDDSWGLGRAVWLALTLSLGRSSFYESMRGEGGKGGMRVSLNGDTLHVAACSSLHFRVTCDDNLGRSWRKESCSGCHNWFYWK